MALEVFSSFPYYKVGNYIFDKNYGSAYLVDDYKENWPTNKLTQIWYYYEDGLNKGEIEPVDIRSSLSSLYYLERVTPYKRADLIWWLEAVQDLAKAGEIDAYFYTGKKVATNPVAKTVDAIKTTIGNIGAEAGKTAKTGLLIGSIGVVLYMTWPLLMKTTRKRISG